MEIKGLSSSTVLLKQKQFGFNELPSSRPKNIFRIALEVIKEPMFLLLISCGILYMLLGDYKEGSILLSTISVIIGITFYQYRKTEKALEALKKLSSPRVLVIRDGTETRIAGREVVPEDIIIINEGDRIPADAQVVDTINLIVDESLLTGESMPVSKTIDTENNNLYSGTLVVQGKALAKVISTGINAQLGKIATSLKNVEEDETRLQQEMKVLIRRFAVAGIFICISVVGLYYFTRGNFIQSLLNGLASAMAILPEEFPVVLTVFLALGSWRLSKKNVLTRKPSAIETLGSATVLCSDKTGTITQNKMDVAALFIGEEIINRASFSAKVEATKLLMSVALNASQENSIDPMEKAIAMFCKNFSIQIDLNKKLLKEYLLSKELFAMTRVHENNNHVLSVSAKGAPEAVLKLCGTTEDETEKYLQTVNTMAKLGYRVIAVADGSYSGEVLPDTQKGFKFKLIGLIGFEDPIREEVPDAIKECSEAGVKVIMITGDFPATAQAIALQCGLKIENIITGDELKNITDEDLKVRIKNTNVFARVVPEQKLRIVQALKANGEIVAMTGDGVNDAPALKAAHIGIAMGNKGTDVAREASSLVLLDDNFTSIVAAIRLGRKIFDNLQKAMTYILAIHIPIIGLTLLPAFVPSLPLLLMPLHIVFMELIIDPVCSIAFESEQEEKGIMRRLPRNSNEKFFGMKQMAVSVLKGILLLAMVLGVYFASISEGHTEGEVRAIAFSSLIIGNIFLILTSLSKTRSFAAVFIERNVAAILILLFAVVLLILVISIPTLQKVFNFDFPGYKHFISSISGALIILLVLEVIKFFKNRELFFENTTN